MAFTMRYLAQSVLAQHLEGVASAINGLAIEVQTDSEDLATFPGLAIVSTQRTFHPGQAEEVENGRINANSVLVEVGDVRQTIEIRLAEIHAVDREDLEDRIIHTFMAQEDTPGSLALTASKLRIAGTEVSLTVPIKYYLRSDQWRDEMAFAKRRYTWLQVDADFSAYAIYGSAASPIYDMDTLVIGNTNDMTETDLTILDYELAQVTAGGGGIEPYP